MSWSFPLTALEECHYWQDRPAYPWSWYARLKFSGCLDRTAFEAAVATVLARHPLLTAKVGMASRRQLHWFLVDDPEPLIQWETGPVGGPLPPAAHQDLQREIGVRFHVRTDATASELTIQFHHACCDGLGGCLFVEDLLLAYALACGDGRGHVKLRPLDPCKLRGRGRFGLTLSTLLRMAPRQLVGMFRGAQCLSRTPVPLVPHGAGPNDDNPPPGYPATLHHVFDEESTIRLRQTAKHLGVTLNDLLVRDLFLAMVEWRSGKNLESGDHWLRMAIGMNLRTAADHLLPIANVASGVFLDRRGPDFADAGQLLQSVHKELALAKRWRLGLSFIFFANIGQWLNGGNGEKYQANEPPWTCALTNLGEPFAGLPLSDGDGRAVAGNVTLDQIDFAAPTAPRGCVAVGVIGYAHRLGLTLHYDPRPLSAAEAADLLATYLRRIRTSLNTAPTC